MDSVYVKGFTRRNVVRAGEGVKERKGASSYFMSLSPFSSDQTSERSEKESV